MNKKEAPYEIFTHWKVIGETGKRDNNHDRIVICRNLQSGELKEMPYRHLSSGNVTGRSRGASHYVSKSIRPSNKTGYVGVYLQKDAKRNHLRWAAKIRGVKFSKKEFVLFEDAVLYANEIQMKHFNPLIYYDDEKIKTIKREEIRRNDYVSSMQQDICESITFNRIEKLKNDKGYTFRKDSGKFQAYIRIERKQKRLGSFSTEAEAKAARKKAVDEQIKILKNQLEKDDL